MADSLNYGMGQLRYSSTNNYLTDLHFSVKELDVNQNAANDDNNGAVYQDVLIYTSDVNFNFTPGVPYLLHLEIPKDSNYASVYRVKLRTAKTDDQVVSQSFSDYQMLKYIEIPKDTTSGQTSRVILYPIVKENDIERLWTVEDGANYTAKVAIAKTDIDSASKGDIVYNLNQYYIWNGTSLDTSEVIRNKNDIILNHVWIADDVQTEVVKYDIVFTPRINDVDFASIWLQMNRITEDDDIFYDGKYGRRINLDPETTNFKAVVYEMTELLNNANFINKKELTNIGVFGHPNLIMAINGEEIRVGQTGYYELNNFDITSLAIAADDNKDRFTVDYQYTSTS